MAAMVLLAGTMAALRLFTGAHNPHGLFSRDSVAILNISGFIRNPKPVVDYARELRTDDSVQGVLVRINSPGGAVAPSQEMYQAIKRLAAVKPVVVSMGTVAASGGYYIAVAADTIVANPASITGSIGVKMEMPNFQELMGKVGVRHVSFTSGKLKNAGSPFSEMSSEERAHLKSLVMDMYTQFVTTVANERGMTPAAVAAVADGGAITGLKAKEVGLIDEIGDLEAAMTILLTQCEAKGQLPVKEGPPKERSLFERLFATATALSSGSFGDAVQTSLTDTMRRRPSYEFLSY